MSRASGSDRASRSSLVTTSVWSVPRAASASRRPDGRGWCRSGVVDVDPLGVDAEGGQAVALGGESCPIVDTWA